MAQTKKRVQARLPSGPWAPPVRYPGPRAMSFTISAGSFAASPVTGSSKPVARVQFQPECQPMTPQMFLVLASVTFVALFVPTRRAVLLEPSKALREV